LQIDKVAKVGKLKIGGRGSGNLKIFEIRKIVLMGYRGMVNFLMASL